MDEIERARELVEEITQEALTRMAAEGFPPRLIGIAFCSEGVGILLQDVGKDATQKLLDSLMSIEVPNNEPH